MYGGYADLVREQPAPRQRAGRARPAPETSEGPHLAYAFQWFLFACLALGGYVVLARREAADRRAAASGATDHGRRCGSRGREPAMASRIEDYALISDRLAAGLVGRDGSIDWLCFPRFDSEAVFAALLGTEENGHWRLAPRSGGTCTSRRYRGDTMVLETEWAGPDGTVRVIDFMPERDEAPDVVRIVEGVSGQVAMRSELRLRFGYGDVVPWVRHLEGMLAAVAGPDAVWLASDVAHHGRDFASHADFTVEAGQRESFVLTWNPSYRPGRTRSTRCTRWTRPSGSGRPGPTGAPTTVRTAKPSCGRCSPSRR